MQQPTQPSPHTSLPPTASTSYSHQQAATTFKRLHPSAYLDRFLAAGVREDARTLDQHRPPTLSLGAVSTAHGSAFVKLQNTVCIAAVKAEVAVPQLARPDEGYLVPNVELPALCSTRFKPGPPGTEAQALSDRLLTFLASSSILDRSSLAIEPGAAVWCLYLDIVFLSYDGNAFDAAVLAAVAALRDTLLPAAVHSQQTGETTADPSRSPSRLALRNLPLCASFCVVDGRHLVADPSAFESALASSHVSIGVCTGGEGATATAKGPICYLYQAGSLGTTAGGDDQDRLETCMTMARLRCADLARVLVEAEVERK